MNKLMYDTILKEHTRIQNEIADIKASNYELSENQKNKVQELEKQQVLLLNRMKELFNDK